MPRGASKTFHSPTQQLRLHPVPLSLHPGNLQDIRCRPGFAPTVAFAGGTLPSDSEDSPAFQARLPLPATVEESFLHSGTALSLGGPGQCPPLSQLHVGWVSLPVRLGGGKETSTSGSTCAASRARRAGPSSSQHHSAQALGGCAQHDLMTSSASVNFVHSLGDLGCGSGWEGRMVGCWAPSRAHASFFSLSPPPPTTPPSFPNGLKDWKKKFGSPAMETLFQACP